MNEMLQHVNMVEGEAHLEGSHVVLTKQKGLKKILPALDLT